MLTRNFNLPLCHQTPFSLVFIDFVDCRVSKIDRIKLVPACPVNDELNHCLCSVFSQQSGIFNSQGGDQDHRFSEGLTSADQAGEGFPGHIEVGSDDSDRRFLKDRGVTFPVPQVTVPRGQG